MKTDDKSLMTYIGAKCFSAKIQIPDREFPSSFYSALFLNFSLCGIN
ncbi:MAG: hypothetical protein LBT10_09505 [Methanobrevibacter sp.]|nr:hypothetical protein [Methanobrevibacter sp.]